MRTEHDVAIYSPASSRFYEDPAAGQHAGPQGGGQELQMTMLARALSREGLRVAHLVWPLEAPRMREAGPAPTLVERPPYAGTGRLDKLREARHIWSAMREANASVYLFRGGGPQLMIGAAFCRRHRRKLVFSSAIDLEFDFRRPDRGPAHLRLYEAAVRRADLVVVQTERQVAMAAKAGLDPVVRIPSFAQPAEPTAQEPEAFLWIGRLVTYKQPLEYVRLAERVPEARFRMVYFELPDSDADHALAAEFSELAARPGNLELLGRLSHARTLEQIERAVAVVSTSRSEGMPNIFLEAWMREVPVVSLQFDPDELLEREGLGILAGGSPEALAQAARSLWSDRDLRARLGTNGRSYVLRVHSAEAVGRTWAEHLRVTLPAPSRSS